MNELETRMIEILKFGRDQGIFAGVKAEFEAEGTRTEEMIRLSDITRRSGLKMGMKIGGGEAVRDLIDCKQLGADFIIAPMIESAYALHKYILMKNRIYSPFERKDVRFLFNVETVSAFNVIDEIIEMACSKDGVDGVVFGRGDYAGSTGASRTEVNTDRVTRDCIEVAKKCKVKKLDYVVGGGMSYEARDILHKIYDAHLTRFETRKIIFHADCIKNPLFERAMAEAGEFELLWLKNKRDYYTSIVDEDAGRIEMLDKRMHQAYAKLNITKASA